MVPYDRCIVASSVPRHLLASSHLRNLPWRSVWDGSGLAQALHSSHHADRLCCGGAVNSSAGSQFCYSERARHFVVGIVREGRRTVVSANELLKCPLPDAHSRHSKAVLCGCLVHCLPLLTQPLHCLLLAQHLHAV